MATITSIWDFIKKYYGLIAIGLFIIASIFLFRTCSDLKTERAQHEFDQKLNEQNTNALIDSITKVYDKKLEAYVFDKQTFMLKFEDLEKYNKQMYNELKKVKGEILYAIQTNAKIELGKIETDNKLEILDKKTNYYGLRFSNTYVDSGFMQKLGGSSRFYVIPNNGDKSWNIKPSITVIDTNSMELKITYGSRKKDKNGKTGYEVFAISKSPIVNLTELNGAYFIDQQPPLRPDSPKNWSFGPHAGFGLNTDFDLKNPRIGWNIGFSVQYRLLQWRMPWEKK